MFVENLHKLEKLFESKKSINSALALCFCYYAAFKLSGNDYFIKKALIISKSELRHSISLCLATAFFDIILLNTDKAKSAINKLNQYKNYFKENEPIIYGCILFLQSLNDIVRKKNASAVKFKKQLEKFSEEQSHYIFPLMLGVLSQNLENYEEAGINFSTSYNRGCRSTILFLCLNDFFDEINNAESYTSIFMAFLNWGLRHSIDLSSVIKKFERQLLKPYFYDNGLLQRIYKIYKFESILKEICENSISSKDYSENANAYYKQAELKQIELPELSQYIIKCAYKSSNSNVSRYSMINFFNSSGNALSDLNLKLFVYHVLLTNKKLLSIAESKKSEIIQFGVYALENNLSGRYYNSLYKFLLDCINSEISELKSLKSIESKIIDKLKEDLFSFDVSALNDRITHIWVMEKERNEVSYYDLKGGHAKVKASSEFFSYICFDGVKKEIVDEKLRIIKLVENADMALYMNFFKKGYTDTLLLIAISKILLSQEEIPYEMLSVLNYAFSLKGISNSFKSQVSAAIGGTLYLNAEFERAAKYYSNVDESLVSNRHIQQMLSVFVKTNKFENAADLIAKKADSIPEQALFSAVKQVLKHEHLRLNVVNACYSLLLKLFYDKALLNAVLKYYKGPLSNLIELSGKLSKVFGTKEAKTEALVANTEIMLLDEVILKNSIVMRKFNVGVQSVFCKVFANNPKNELIGLFTYYCIYEIIINNVKPEYETIDILEQMYFKFGDKLIAYALSTVYVGKNVMTLKSQQILEQTISYIEEDGFILETFKDLNLNSPYIEKKQPFVYRCQPNKDVYLHYRFDNEQRFSCKKMIYFRFGLYLANVTHFYGEKLNYYFSEEMQNGSIVTKEQTVFNDRLILKENAKEKYFEINNALIYEHKFKYEQVEEIITNVLKDLKTIRGIRF